MGNQDKPKLSIKKQIERLKSKGIKFECYSETDAYYFLQNNSYLFKLKALQYLQEKGCTWQNFAVSRFRLRLFGRFIYNRYAFKEIFDRIYA